MPNLRVHGTGVDRSGMSGWHGVEVAFDLERLVVVAGMAAGFALRDKVHAAFRAVTSTVLPHLGVHGASEDLRGPGVI